MYLLLMASAVVLVAGHGWQQVPPSRNHLRNQGPAPPGIIYNQVRHVDVGVWICLGSYVVSVAFSQRHPRYPR